MKLVQFRNFFWLLSFCVCFSSFLFWSSSFLLLLHSKRNKKRSLLHTTTTPQHTQRKKNNNKRKNQIDQIIIKIKMQGARQSDVFFGERESGQDVRQSNVTAVQAVANIVKSSLGPVGLDKVLVILFSREKVNVGIADRFFLSAESASSLDVWRKFYTFAKRGGILIIALLL